MHASGWSPIAASFSFVALLVLASCSPASRVGVVLTADGAISILVVHCDDQELASIDSVSLRRLPRADSFSLDEDTQTLWSVSAVRPTGVTDFVVGAQPRGFSTKTPLRTQPGRRQYLAAVVEGSDLWGTAHFSLSDLLPGLVFYSGKHLLRSDFERAARSGGGCPRNAPRLLGLGTLILIGGGLGALGIFTATRRREPRH